MEYVGNLLNLEYCMHLDSITTKIFVAGHLGLVGSAVVRALSKAGYANLITATRQEVDLTDSHAVDMFIDSTGPDLIILAAAKVGGILANSSAPADFLYDNVAIQSNVLHSAWRHGVSRVVFLGSTCIYPRLCPQPMKEEYLMTGPLEPTNEAYALAKIMGVKYCSALHSQYGADYFSVLPTNVYGPGDNFDLKTAHALPAFIRRFHEAVHRGSDVTIWGSGTPRREWLHVDDLADGIVHLCRTPADQLRRFAPDGVVNLGVGKDVSILELAEVVADVTGYRGKIELDATKPDGMPRKLVDCSRATALGWSSRTNLRQGIETTYEWFKEHVVANISANA